MDQPLGTLDALQALEDSEARAKSVLESVVDGVVTIDAAGAIESVNAAAERLFLYSASDLIGKNVSMLMPPPFAREHDSYLEGYLAGGPKRVIGIGRDVVGRRKDGSTFPMRLSVGEWTLGDKRMFTGICHDLTEQERAFRKVGDLVRIVENSLNEIYVFSASDLGFRYVNKRARLNLGYSTEELSDLTPIDLEPEVSQETFTEAFATLRSGKSDQVRLTSVHRRKDGSDYPVEVSLQLDSYEGEPVFVAIVLDVAERLENERKVAESRKLAVLGDLAGKIAHEVNNPIAIIMGKAHLALRRSEEMSPKLRRDLQKIIDQCERVSLLNRSLLSYSRPSIEAKLPLDLNRPIREVLDLVTDKAQRCAVSVGSDLAESLPPIKGNSNELEQVFLNLLLNAIDATSPEGGEVSIRTEASADGRSVLAYVADTGPGVHPDHLDQIFEPFFSTKGDKGNGLGLSICQGVVRGHGGSIETQAVHPHGVEFKLTFPCERGASQAVGA